MRRISPYPLVLAGVAGLYIGAAKLGIELPVAHGVITPVWAPSGIALVALVLLGPRAWPAVALGAFVANATSGASVAVAVAIAVGNTLEAVAGSVLLRRVGFRPALDRVRDVLALVGLGALVSTTIAATSGVTALWLAGEVSGASYGSDWLLWWSGDAMGDLVLAPLLFVWAAIPHLRLSRAALAEAVLLLGLVIGVSCVVFLAGYWRYPHLLFPLLVWAALRFHQRGVVTASFAVAAIAIAGAVNGSTPVGGTTGTEVVQILEALIAATIVSVLIVGALLAEREEAVRDRERAGRALAEAQEVARIGSWEWDIAANDVMWSDELYRLYGLDPGGPVTYEAYVERIHPADRELVRETVAQARATGEPFAYDHRILGTDGGVRWVHGRGRVVVDASGKALRMVGTSQDITERKRLDELRDNILAAVSHELRTPLTAIIGFAVTLLEKGASLPAETRAEIVTHLAEQARRLERLLSDLLDLDRLRHGALTPRFRPTDVGELATRVAATSSNGRPLDVRVEPVTAEGDAPKVERIVENLLANAARHTPADAEVRLRVEPLDDSVLIAVDDRGPGVPPEDRDAIFELFNRAGAPPAVAGTGVGLSLVAQFAALHGGRAWVEDNPGGGASFRVVLPTRRPE